MTEEKGNEGTAGFADIDVSVVLASYTEERLDSIHEALASLRKQSLEPKRVIVAVDNNKLLADHLKSEFDWITVALNEDGGGSSATRNWGVKFVDTRFTAFLDDDETADPDWLMELMQPFRDSDVVGTGGVYQLVWESGTPSWFPEEFAWVVGGSYLGMPTETTEVRNVWSGNMAVRTEAFREVGGFRTELGKHGSASHPEDTDLCIRLTRLAAGRWIYVPSAIIHHHVHSNRATLKFFVFRCYAEGYGKALMSLMLESTSAIELERAYVGTAARAGLRRMGSLKWSSTVQGLVIFLGLGFAAAGFLRGRLLSPRNRET